MWCVRDRLSNFATKRAKYLHDFCCITKMKERFPSRFVFLDLGIPVGSPVLLINAFVLLVAIAASANTSVLAQVAQPKQNPNRTAVFERTVGSHVARSGRTL